MTMRIALAYPHGWCDLMPDDFDNPCIPWPHGLGVSPLGNSPLGEAP